MKPLGLFDAAYLRLTAWYVAIIMAISLAFSIWVYNQAANELRFGLQQSDSIIFRTPAQAYIEERLDVTRQRLIGNLVLLNVVVLIAGAGASYLLARRTMQPIVDALDAQERFTADASHELRTPLAAMKTEIEVGLRDGKITKDEAIELLKSNLEEVDRLGSLAEGLLTLTQTGDAPLELKPVSLEEVVGAMVKRMQPLADAKKVTIKKDLQPVIVQANEPALEKIIGILLDNAIKYSPEKSVVTVKTYPKDGHSVLEVQDRGVGIKATELPHIFDRFYRADTSRTKQAISGHGLGLSIAQKLATQMQTKITANSTTGKGSVFKLRLY